MKVTKTIQLAGGAMFCAVALFCSGEAFAEGSVLYQSDAAIAPPYVGDVESFGCGASCDSCGDSCGECCDTCCGTCPFTDCLSSCGEMLSGLCGGLERCDPDNPCSDGFLFGLFAPTDPCFNDFISPMTNPVFFEDPRTLSEARLIYLHHKIPAVTSGVAAGGGDVNVVALQIRAALNDRVSIIATKTGYATSTNPLVDDGWADINIGVKFNLMADYEAQRLLSAGITYELPVGSTRTLQGNGDGLFNLFASYGEEVGCNAHWISGLGFLIAADDAAENDMFYWSNHLDYHLGAGWYALAEVNWYNYLRSGAGGIPGVGGGDLFNFGSTGVAGNDIVTGAFGAKYKPYEDMEIGVAWEAPLTDRRDILENRLTVDLILRF